MEENVSKMPSITEAIKLNSNELKKFSLESAVSVYFFNDVRNFTRGLCEGWPEDSIAGVEKAIKNWLLVTVRII